MSLRLLMLSQLCLMLFGWSLDQAVLAEEQGETATAEKDTDKKADDAESADPYAVPDGTNEELLKYIRKLEAMQPPENDSREAMIETFKKKLQATAQAAEKILSQQPDDKTRAEAVQFKLAALSRMVQLGDADALVSLQKYATELAAGDNKQLAELGRVVLSQLKMRKIATGDLEGAEDVIKEFAAQLEKNPDDVATVRLALGLASALENLGDKGTKLAVLAYQQFAKGMAASSNPQIVEYGKKLEGVVRRLELVGNSMELSGTLLDGTTFNPDTLKGKVVVVDFWATWCGPCIAELPNLLANYEKYHAKGFEVIGVSLDNDRETLEKFLEERKLPWTVLYEDGDGTRGWDNPLAAKYGIVGIPTVILINAEGKVVSLNARGEKLAELLAELLGDDKS